MTCERTLEAGEGLSILERRAGTKAEGGGMPGSPRKGKETRVPRERRGNVVGRCSQNGVIDQGDGT